MRTKSQVNKTSDLPNGVCRCVEQDWRYPRSKPVVVYSALIKVNGKRTNSHFRVKQGESEARAMEAAIKCRADYEDLVSLNGE